MCFLPVICLETTQPPIAFMALTGYFNHVSLGKLLPTFHQYVDNPTRKNKTLDLLYANTSDAYKTTALPPPWQIRSQWLHQWKATGPDGISLRTCASQPSSILQQESLWESWESRGAMEDILPGSCPKWVISIWPQWLLASWTNFKSHLMKVLERLIWPTWGRWRCC